MADWNDYVEKSGGDLEAASRAYKNDVPLDEFDPSGSPDGGTPDDLVVQVGRESAHFGQQGPGDSPTVGKKTGTVKELACGTTLKVPADYDAQQELANHDCPDPSAHENDTREAHEKRNGSPDGDPDGGGA